MQSNSSSIITISLAVFSVAIGLVHETANSQETEIMDTLILSEFTGDSPDLGWYIQNDNVMGGKARVGSR